MNWGKKSNLQWVGSAHAILTATSHMTVTRNGGTVSPCNWTHHSLTGTDQYAAFICLWITDSSNNNIKIIIKHHGTTPACVYVYVCTDSNNNNNSLIKKKIMVPMPCVRACVRARARVCVCDRQSLLKVSGAATDRRGSRGFAVCCCPAWPNLIELRKYRVLSKL